MTQVFKNNAYGSLAAELSAVGTVATLATGNGANFPAPTGGDHFLATLILLDGNGAESAWEIVKCTARATDGLTIERAQEGTTARIWPAGTRIELRTTAGTLDSFTDTAQAAAAAPVQSVAGKTGAVTLAKGDVGLGNVDNTSDANKPVSTAQQTALNGKENTGTAAAAVSAHKAESDPHPQYQVDLVSGTNIKTINGQSILGAGNIEIQAGVINHIGTPGALGFGVGIAPTLPTNFVEMAGCRDSASDNYGNYMHTSGSVMVWIPAFYYKWGTGANGLSVNVVDIKPFSAYADVATANAAGYALHRAFYDGGVQPGFFIDKYLCSNLNGVFSSIKNGIPCDTDGSQSGIAALTDVGTNNYGFIQKACTQRGTNFHSASIFMHRALALLSYAHAQASSNTTYCAWYNATYNFPKGCNNNALGDTNDAALSFTSAGHSTYPNKPKAGSGSVFAKTTHNGQNSGVSDLNGSMWEVAFGLTSDGTNYYLLKTTKKMRDLIGSDATSATSFFGAAGITANYDNIGATYGALLASSTSKLYGSTTQVFDAATSGNAWAATGAGLPLAGGVGGTNAFGSDVLYDYRPNEMCPLVGAGWGSASYAGVWALGLFGVRSGASSDVGGRAALYL